MILPSEKNDVTVNGAQRTETFSIKASAKAYSILTENLYSDRIGSVCREIGASNMFDAHVAAGHPEKPAHIKLPNDLDPTIKFRDYGTGLSDEDMYSLYTTMFASTKESSNDFIGAFGIGRMSFFSVSNSANITSYFNGVKTVYVAFLNDDGIPSLSTFSSHPTDEPNGLEVEIAVKKDEIYYWKQAVNNQLKYFKVKPTISGDSQFKWDLEEDYVYEGTNWKMVGKGRYGSIRAVQGQVSYPINTHSMGAAVDKEDSVLLALLRANLLLTFEIGEININPSRESLSYDDATVKNILDKAKVVLKELPAQIHKRINGLETKWEAILLYRDITDSLGGSGAELLKEIEKSGEINWHGEDVSENVIHLDKDLIGKSRSFTKGYQSSKWKKTSYELSNQYSEDSDPYWNISVYADKTLVYVNGNDKASDARIKQYCVDNSIKTPYILETDSKDDTFEEVRAALGHPVMLRASDMEKVRRVKSTGPKVTTTTLKYFGYGWNKTDRWAHYDTFDTISEAEGLYVDLDRVSAVKDGVEIKDFETIRNNIISLGLMEKDEFKIYGLTKRQRTQDHNLVNLFDFIQKRIDELDIQVYDFNKVVFGGYFTDDSYIVNDLLKELPKSSDMYKIAHAIKENKEKNITQKVQNRFKSVGINMKGKNMDKLVEKVHSKYPLIKGSRYYCKTDEVIDYCKQMDMLEKMGLLNQ